MPKTLRGILESTPPQSIRHTAFVFRQCDIANSPPFFFSHLFHTSLKTAPTAASPTRPRDHPNPSASNITQSAAIFCNTKTPAPYLSHFLTIFPPTRMPAFTPPPTRRRRNKKPAPLQCGLSFAYQSLTFCLQIQFNTFGIPFLKQNLQLTHCRLQAF